MPCKGSCPVVVNLEGQFVTVGNMPFTKLAFRANDGKTYEMQPAEADEFRTLQGKMLRIEALSGSLLMESADGKHSRRIYYIKNVKILVGEGS